MRAAVYTVVFFFLAPGANAVLVPWLLTGWDHPASFGALDVLGALLVAAGLAVVVACFARFVTEGHGTPAPTAPTDTLVVGGIYRHVRNPMYVGVAAMIGGQALLFRSGSTPSGCCSSWPPCGRSCTSTRSPRWSSSSGRRTRTTARPCPAGGRD